MRAHDTTKLLRDTLKMSEGLLADLNRLTSKSPSGEHQRPYSASGRKRKVGFGDVYDSDSAGMYHSRKRSLKRKRSTRSPDASSGRSLLRRTPSHDRPPHHASADVGEATTSGGLADTARLAPNILATLQQSEVNPILQRFLSQTCPKGASADTCSKVGSVESSPRVFPARMTRLADDFDSVSESGSVPPPDKDGAPSGSQRVWFPRAKMVRPYPPTCEISSPPAWLPTHLVIDAAPKIDVAPVIRGASRACAPPPSSLYDDVLLSPDYLTFIMDALHRTCGLRAARVASTCKAWRDGLALRQEAWKVLQVERRIGTHGSASGQFSMPSDVTLLPCGSVCVADSGNSRLQIFGENSRTIGSCGPWAGQFEGVRGVACDDDSIYATDGHRIQKFRIADGEPIGALGSHGSGEGQFDYPQGVCVVGDNVYVCDGSNNRIVVLDRDLQWKYSFGGREEDFCRPMSIAAHKDELFIADHGNDRVQVFTRGADDRMHPSRTIGRRGDAPGEFHMPSGVAIVHGETDSMLVVSEFWGKRLQMFTLEGKPLQVLKTDAMLGHICAHKGIVLVAAPADHAVIVVRAAGV